MKTITVTDYTNYVASTACCEKYDKVPHIHLSVKNKGLGCVTLLSIIFYILAVSIIEGRNRSMWRKPLTCHKALSDKLYHIMLY
jgi:hypothetical protein